jgi:hypothetical protein
MTCWFLLCLCYYSLQPKSPGKRKEENIDQHPRKCLQNVHSFHVFLLYKVNRKLLQKSGSAWDLSLSFYYKKEMHKIKY